MATESSVPTNLYFVKQKLPFIFREESPNYIAMDKVVTPSQFPEAFANVFKKMQEVMTKSDKRGAPEPLTLEAATALAAARKSEGQPFPTMMIMVAVYITQVSGNCAVEVPAIKTLVAVNGGTHFYLRLTLRDMMCC